MNIPKIATLPGIRNLIEQHPDLLAALRGSADVAAAMAVLAEACRRGGIAFDGDAIRAQIEADRMASDGLTEEELDELSGGMPSWNDFWWSLGNKASPDCKVSWEL